MDCDIGRGPKGDTSSWRALTGRALVPSGYNTPELMSVALRHWNQGHLATVYGNDDLRLAFPLRARRFPLPVFENLTTPVNFHGLPHVDADFAAPALAALLRKAGRPLLLRSVPLDGPFREALQEASGRFEILHAWERAVLRPEGTFTDWFENSFERKRRKEYRRLRARLGEQGRLELMQLGPGEATASWVSEFLALESAGWKGDLGTAMNADPLTVRALGEACKALGAAGKLRFWKLALDGKAIAMLYGIVDGDSIWLGKIAYDEAWSKFSPGVLIILDVTERIFAEGICFADSCAIPDHPMINHLWRDRLHVADVLVSSRTVSAAAFAATVAAERLTRTLRKQARNLRNTLTGRHRS